MEKRGFQPLFKGTQGSNIFFHPNEGGMMDRSKITSVLFFDIGFKGHKAL